MVSTSYDFPEFKDKAILITGASTGIGAELARAFAAQGAKVGLHYNSSKEQAEALADEIRAAGGTVVLIQADACDTKALVEAVENAADALGGLDGLINNAVALGVITSPFHERYSTKEQLAAMQATIPQGRLGIVEDCGGAFLFLASDEMSAYIIGQTIEVNGGQLMP
ncbi:MAG: SDR family oxidoreductase [Boseongicola sp.]|nr:MAG: SDR family oxidoreductase [Boseongicola sp.]